MPAANDGRCERAPASPLALVADLGRQARTETNPQRLMDRAVRQAAASLGAEFGGVLELLPDGRAVFQAGVGWKEGVAGQATLELNDRFASGRVIRTQAP